MIRYRLICERGHEFDAWFRDSVAYDEQKAAGQLCCPHCGVTQVEKTLMTPNLSLSSKRQEETEEQAPQMGPPSLGGGPSSSLSPQDVREAIRAFRRHIEENAEYVGKRFAEEARRIHYEEDESRGIYGEATREEAEELLEEGIAFYPLPKLPEEHN